MMIRRLAALGAGALLAIPLFVDAASAQTCVPDQYTVCPTTTTTSSTTSTSTPASTTTTVQATTTTTAPAPPQVDATTTNSTPKPGESVPIATPPANNAPAIDTTKPVAAVMVNADPDKPDVPMPAPKITVNANGSQTISVTVPPSTPAGIYVIAIVGTAPNGTSRVIIVPVVVRRNVTSSSLKAAATEPPAGPTVVVPADVRRIAASVSQAGGAAAVEDAVLHDGATLKISNGQLVVFRPDASSSDDARPLVAAFAVALAGGGLVLLRRRTPAISKRSN